LTLWNGGLLLYHLVLAGQDCADAVVASYGYNIAVIVKRKSIPPDDDRRFKDVLNYLPEELRHERGFDGNILNIGW